VVVVAAANTLLLNTVGNADELKFTGKFNEGCLILDDVAVLNIVFGSEGASDNAKLCLR